MYRPPTEKKKGFHTRCHSQKSIGMTMLDVVEYLKKLEGACADPCLFECYRRVILDVLDKRIMP
jgi:hypothetical protein